MRAEPTSKRPNILVLMTDQQRFDTLACAGHPFVSTPNLDRLAERGAMFERCYVQNPICSPSRASFATGRYVHAHGLWANGVALPADMPLISKALANLGYDCGMAGKQHLGPCIDGDEPRLDDGYRVYKWSHDPIHRSLNNAYHLWLRRHHPEIFRSVIEAGASEVESGNIAKGASPVDTVPRRAHYSRWIAEEAIAFIEDAGRPAGTPFYFMANFFDPHHPFGAPEEFRSLYDADVIPPPSGSAEELRSKPPLQMEYHLKSYAGQAPGFAEYSDAELRETRAAYLAMISLVDAEVGRIIDALERRALFDDTLIVFTSDHGEMLGDHAMMLKGPMLYDPAVRVPLILSWPVAIPAGTRVPNLVQNIDITATLAEVGGASSSFARQGESLMGLIRDERPDWRDWALCEYRNSGRSVSPPVHTTMLRKGRFKLIMWHGRPATDRARSGELYDLEADPEEIFNLYADSAHAPVREEMKDMLIDVLDATEWPRPIRSAAW